MYYNHLKQLARNDIEDVGASAISNSLEKNTHISKLHIGICGL